MCSLTSVQNMANQRIVFIYLSSNSIMASAQGALEYLAIIAAVLGIAAVLVYSISGVVSAQVPSAAIGTCKQAAIDCKNSRLVTPNDPCPSCDSACRNPSTGKELFFGAISCCNT